MFGIFPQQEKFIIIILVLVAIVALAVKVSFMFQDFLLDLRYLNSEIRRTEGAEQRHWKRERRRLWLSLINPFRKG